MKGRSNCTAKDHIGPTINEVPSKSSLGREATERAFALDDWPLVLLVETRDEELRRDGLVAFWPSAKPAVNRVVPPPNARARRLAAICSIGTRFPSNLISRGSLVPTFEDEVGAIA